MHQLTKGLNKHFINKMQRQPEDVTLRADKFAFFNKNTEYCK